MQSSFLALTALVLTSALSTVSGCAANTANTANGDDDAAEVSDLASTKRRVAGSVEAALTSGSSVTVQYDGAKYPYATRVPYLAIALLPAANEANTADSAAPTDLRPSDVDV